MAQPPPQERPVPVEAPPKEAPKKVVIPQLTKQEFERRAGKAFDGAVAGIMQRYFSKPPDPEEVAEFRQVVQSARESLSRGKKVDLGKLLDDFCKQHKDYDMAFFNRFSFGSADWILKKGEIEYNPEAFAKRLAQYLASAKRAFVASLVKLSDPEKRSVPVAIASIDHLIEIKKIKTPEGDVEKVRITIGRVLEEELAKQFKGEDNPLPVKSRYNESDKYILFTSLIPPPQTATGRIGAKEFERKP
jgi:hypothetical protein